MGNRSEINQNCPLRISLRSIWVRGQKGSRRVGVFFWAGAGRQGAMCSGTGGREVFLKQKLSLSLSNLLPSPKVSEPVEATRGRRAEDFSLLFTTDLTFLVSESSFSPSTIEFSAFLHGGDGGKLKTSYSACRELQELQLCLHFLCDFSAFIFTDSLEMKLYWSSRWNWVIAAGGGTAM